MINYVYCFDENYNFQALTSINSLLLKTSSKINLFIIHNNPTSFNLDLLDKSNINNLQIFQIAVTEVQFPNLSGTHVSEATYYRFYLSKFLPNDLDYIVYMDADILCLNDPTYEIEKYIKMLSESNYNLGARTETLRKDLNNKINPFKNLKLENNKYFNAGLMIIDFQYWIKNNLENELLKIMDQFYKEIIFWDQDVLNKLFDGNYLEISENLNYDFDVFNKDKYNESLLLDNVKFLHYSGKGKPWDVNFVFLDSAKIYQKYYRLLNLNKYLLSHSNSIKGSRKKYFLNILSFKFLKLEFPFSYLFLSLKSLTKIKIRFFNNKKIIYDEIIVERKKPENIKRTDESLFSHEYIKKIPISYIRNLNYTFIINNSIFDIKKLRIYTKETFYENHTISKKVKDTIKNLMRSNKGFIKIEKGIWILDTKSENFGHWMIDALCRYQLVPRDFQSYDILLPKRFTIDWILEMLDHLGYQYKILEENKKYLVKNLILTSRAHPSGNYNLEIVNNLRDTFLAQAVKNGKNKQRRIWAYREHISRTVGNFDEIEKVLKKYNFELIKTDQLTLKEKINLLNETKIISGTHGSGLINLFFMNKKSKVFEVRDLNDNLKNAVYSLASALDIKYYYMERETDLDFGGNINPQIFEMKLLECIEG